MYDIDNSDGHMPCKIKVRVKSSMIPHLSEFVFEVNRQLTVGVLKNWISAVFKDYVSISEQQLLSGDCIAKNSQEISQFIKDDPNSVTFHLTTASESSLLSLSVPGLFIPFNVLGCDSFSQDIPGLGKTEQNTLDETVKSCSGSCDCTWLPIYYQAAVVNNELCLLKILNHSNVCSLDKESFSTEKRSPYRVLLMSSENVVQHINQNVQNNSQFLNTAVDSDSHVQNPGINNERLRMIFVHLCSWIRFCTLVIIALQFFLVWHTGHRDRNSHRNEQSSLGSEPELSQSISHDQGHNQNTEFNWGRNLGYRVLTFIIRTTFYALFYRINTNLNIGFFCPNK
ncbi:unnamed protein product [Pneumocystis jirovecii]|uniref:Ubiquitin-like domain-containing protein n=1 Tax=Pneumocystis jirovecii TaxID=42068 RepID=L0PAA6_PNEJI|nr:unnamed protein product [Pneumocystis jirovecii]